jgi:hypothetical protein
MGNHRTQQVTQAAVMQNRNCSKEETCGQQHGSAGKTFFSKYTTPDRSFTTALHSSHQQHVQQPSQQKQQQSSGLSMYQDTNKISNQSVQAKNVNINATDNMFLTFTMVQQIRTELSGAAKEKEKVAVTTKAVFTLLKNNANNSS